MFLYHFKLPRKLMDVTRGLLRSENASVRTKEMRISKYFRFFDTFSFIVNEIYNSVWKKTFIRRGNHITTNRQSLKELKVRSLWLSKPLYINVLPVVTVDSQKHRTGVYINRKGALNIFFFLYNL